jgi:hypothetical protein
MSRWSRDSQNCLPRRRSTVACSEQHATAPLTPWQAQSSMPRHRLHRGMLRAACHGTGVSEGLADDFDRPLNHLARDIQVAHRTDALRAGGEGEDTGGFQLGGDVGRGSQARVEIEEDHVGFDRHGDGEAGNLGEAGAKASGVFVVFGEACAVVIEGVEGRGGEDAGLAHGAAEHLAEAEDTGDGGLVAGDGGTGGGAQALGEAAGDGVEIPGVAGGVDAGGRGGVPDAGAVEVQLESKFAGAAGDPVDLLQGPDGAAAAVLGVFDDDELGMGEVVGVGADELVELVGVEEAAGAGGGADHDAGKGGGCAGLVVDDVAVDVADDLITGLGVGADGGLVGHGAGRDEAGGFFAHEFGDAVLEADDGGVITQDIIPDLGIGHGLAHGGGGAGDGVAAEVDWGVDGGHGQG